LQPENGWEADKFWLVVTKSVTKVLTKNVWQEK
jgi:hypothetical protein